MPRLYIRRPPIDRFLAQVRAGAPDECWLWTGYVSRLGYGSFYLPPGEPGSRRPHRWYYEYRRGTLPVDRQLDHLCRNKLCVNPAHLEPVSARVNVMRSLGVAAINARKTHCKKGHQLEGANLGRQGSSGKRKCITCGRDASRAYRRRKRQAA